MAIAKKTFKIGEYAKGGVISVIVNAKNITIIGKDWDFSTGSRKSSDQSNAKEFTRANFDANLNDSYRNALDFLCDLTTSYYADTIMKWIETKVTFEKKLNW